MATRSEISQLTTTISIPREEFLAKIVQNRSLKKKDYIVLLFLLTQLEGWNSMQRKLRDNRTLDPLNFKRINIADVSTNLYLSKEEVRASIRRLLDQGILERGSSAIVSKGYRFTF